MRVFWIAFINSIKRHVRSITPFIMQVMSTLIIIIILGSALSGNFKTDDLMDPIRVAVVNEDTGKVSGELINFLNSSSMKKLIRITESQDVEAAKQSLKENKYDGVIEIKSNYSEVYMRGNFDGIETYLTDNDKTTFQVISSVLNGWKNNSSAVQLAVMSGRSMEDITSELQNSNNLIKEMPLSKSGKLPKAMDYYTITMAVMTLLYSGFNALGRIQEDFLSDMKNRLQSASASIGSILTGELLGVALMSFLQMVFVVLFAHFVYGANLGNNYGAVFGTLFLMTIFGQMLAAALALGLKNSNAAMGIIQTLALGLTFLSGGFYASPIKGSAGKFLATYGTPNSLAQTAIFGSIYGGDTAIILTCMGILALLSIILMGLTISLAKGKLKD